MMRLIGTLLLILITSGCASTKKTVLLNDTQSIYDANKTLEYVLNDPDPRMLLDLIDKEASETYAKDEIGISEEEFALNSAIVTIAALKGLSRFDHVVYSHSRTQGNYWYSHYIFSNNNGSYALVDLVLTKQGKKLVDVHNHVFRSSVVNYLGEYEKHIEQKGYDDALTKIEEQIENNDPQSALEHYLALPEEVRMLGVVHESLFRFIKRCSSEAYQAFCNRVLSDSQHEYQGLLRANLYSNLNEYAKALSEYEQVPEAIRSSAPILMEEAVLQARQGNKREGFALALDALYRASGHSYGYLMLLQVSLFSGEHEFSAELLSFIKKTFEIQFTEQELADFSGDSGFIQSDQYAQFKLSYF
ncbi:hypothetical protein [Pseudoalteromonas sp. R3]|uniref:hypothetical protein n=1 Tax=Pseudoalteromonas sp. R3 TaxID=1709477 RepID=UPI0006B41312|nr:hypothetical protein [Pseudoalteromonas sp. R3]AZZ96445.1 hypothetical protein ELR70_04510 [Pseudoalteromonas sp. R3]